MEQTLTEKLQAGREAESRKIREEAIANPVALVQISKRRFAVIERTSTGMAIDRFPYAQFEIISKPKPWLEAYADLKRYREGGRL